LQNKCPLRAKNSKVLTNNGLRLWKELLIKKMLSDAVLMKSLKTLLEDYKKVLKSVKRNWKTILKQREMYSLDFISVQMQIF
jgi:hypothetical protein